MVVLVCSSKEQPLVFGVQRCCAASVMGLALEMFQLVEKAREWRGSMMSWACLWRRGLQ